MELKVAAALGIGDVASSGKCIVGSLLLGLRVSGILKALPYRMSLEQFDFVFCIV